MKTHVSFLSKNNSLRKKAKLIFNIIIDSVLQRHYAGLQAAALEHPIEDVVDMTLPNNTAIFKASRVKQ
jgi:hypothetical protein